MTVNIITLGCSKNLVDSEHLDDNGLTQLGERAEGVSMTSMILLPTL